MENKIIGIYHKDCIDGTTAAAVLLKKFPRIALFPLKRDYNDADLAPILEHMDKDAVVYVVDFSFNQSDYSKLLSRVKKIINIDHHISAKEELGSAAAHNKNFEFIFDNNRSGASLAWVYFFEDEAIPELIALVEDGDIGKFEFPEKTKWSGGVLMPLVNKPETIKNLFKKPIEDILSRGRAITDFMDFALALYKERANPITLLIDGHSVVAYNATFNIERMRSTLGHELAEKHQVTVALFRISGGEATFSFRGLDHIEPSALALAEKLNGGGHRNAAGARVTLKEFLQMVKFDK